MRRISIFSLVAVSLYASAQQQHPIAKGLGPLQAAITALSPTARVLQASEIDMRECESVPKTPGLVKADFNGDGFEDAAVLLVTHDSTKTYVSGGVKYREATLVLAILLNDTKGGYTAASRETFQDSIPAWHFLTLVPAPQVFHGGVDDEETLELRNPGVMLTFCGKSASVYGVTGFKVRTIDLLSE